MKTSAAPGRAAAATLAITAALFVSACASSPSDQPAPVTDESDSEASAPAETEPAPEIDTPNKAVVQVDDWTHTYPIPDHLSDMCEVSPDLNLLTVRNMQDDSEFFEWKFDEPGSNGVVFAVESEQRAYAAGEAHAQEFAEGLGTTTAVPSVTDAMFEIQRGSAQGTIEMLDLLADSTVTAQITITCE